MEWKARRLLLREARQTRPRRHEVVRRLVCRPRTARAWNRNQQLSLTEPLKEKSKEDLLASCIYKSACFLSGWTIWTFQLFITVAGFRFVLFFLLPFILFLSHISTSIISVSRLNFFILI